MNASLDRSSPSSLRTRSPLVHSLALVGLLSAQGALAATWNINFTPKQTTGTPSQPVFSWTPSDSGTLFGTVIECTDGAISASSGAGTGVYGLDTAPHRRAFVQLANIYASPSNIAVEITPDTAGGTANCRMESVPTSFNPSSGGSPEYNVNASIRDGWVSGIFANEDPTGWQLSFSAGNSVGSNTIFYDDPYSGAGISTQLNSGPIIDSEPVTTNLFMNGKTTTATVEYELTQPQSTDTTITFTVQAELQAYDTAYDPAALGYLQPAYATPQTITVTIPAGTTSVQVPIPDIVPGSQVTLTPVSHDGFNIVNTPILIKTTPLPVATTSDPSSLTNLVPPGNSGVYTQTSPTNIVDFKIVLDKPFVQPPDPEPKPATPVPTLNEWSLGLLGLLMAGIAAVRNRSWRQR